MTNRLPIQPDDTASRLQADVEQLALPAGRRVGTEGHRRAERHLATRLAEEGMQPYGDAFELPYRQGSTEFVNLVGVAPGRDTALAPALIAAHYDTAGDWAGADDNAAAVAIALEVARRLRAEPADRDVVIALFDAEEPPYFHTVEMGSVHFYERQARGPVHAALVMDLVGHDVPLPGRGELLFVTGMESDPDLERTILGLPDVEGVRIVTALNRYVGDLSDHHVFRRERVPYLFLTCGRWRHYHQPSDTPEQLNYAKMAATSDLLEAMTRDVAARDLAGPWEGYDTTDTDLQTMRAGLGPLPMLMGTRLRSREDIERVAMRLQAVFGL